MGGSTGCEGGFRKSPGARGRRPKEKKLDQGESSTQKKFVSRGGEALQKEGGHDTEFLERGTNWEKEVFRSTGGSHRETKNNEEGGGRD